MRVLRHFIKQSVALYLEGLCEDPLREIGESRGKGESYLVRSFSGW